MASTDLDGFMRPKFCNSSMSMREDTQPQFYKRFTRKTKFFERCSWYGLEILQQRHKRVKIKS